MIKGGAFLKARVHLKAIAFNKTGILTRGRLKVLEVISMAEVPESGVLQLASSLEAQTDHPVARAILTHAKGQGLALLPVKDFEIIPGKGARGRMGDQIVWAGSPRWAGEQEFLNPKLDEHIQRASVTGAIVILVGTSTEVVGLITAAHEVRPVGVETLKKPREAGLQHLVMLTGEHEGAAERVAQELGIKEFQADLLPYLKVRVVEELVGTHGSVAMVGDGVNDAPALARGTIGIAMGTAGSDAAIETADIALMSDDLTRLPWLIGHSKRTLRTIQQNISFSLGVKALFILLTLAGRASLWSTIAADMGTSILVVFNGLKLLKW